MRKISFDKNRDLLRSSYHYDLPDHLIAERPGIDPGSDRLLVYDQATDKISHLTFRALPEIVPRQSTFIFNRSRVFPCRFFGKKPSGGKVEVFFLAPRPDEKGEVEVLLKSSGKKNPGDRILIDQLGAFEIVQTLGGTFVLKGENFNLENNSLGMIPIPPYIRGGISDKQDHQDYQTVYAKESGSVAAPTAGLHFDQELLKQIDQNHHRAELILHVGLGTFSPIKVDDILEHKMHTERFTIDKKNSDLINKSSFRVAVGTTTLRALESGPVADKMSETDLFLYPGKEVHSIDALVTNFHLPESSLLMLVSSLLGREKTLEIYREAVAEKYRFFSYGDGMCILRDPKFYKDQS